MHVIPSPFNCRARADWIELIRLSGQSLLSVPSWDTILSSIPPPPTRRKSPLSSMRDLSLNPKSEASNGNTNSSKLEYPITTERAAIISQYLEDVVFGDGIPWDLTDDQDKAKGRKRKGR
jgi:hypothetical protein